MKISVAVLFALLALAVITPEAYAVCSINDPANYTCLDFQNKSSQYVTVQWDGNYGCNTAPGTTCSFIVPIGNHHFTARANNGRFWDFGNGYAGPGCCDREHLLWVWDAP